MTSQLEQLKKYTVVVADTGDLDAIAHLQPQDATTNPSLLLKAATLPGYSKLLRQAYQANVGNVSAACEQFAVDVGKEILQVIPGRISTEVDARLSFNQEATYTTAKRLMDRYNAAGISNDRVLIKIAATWEGIRAAERLEKQGIQTNLTLIFSFAQAAASADAGAYLISPFVGRIYDWYKKHNGTDYTAESDPGVQSVARIYRYFKTHHYATIVMGASFRNLGQIQQLAGCDRLTISPELLEQLAQSNMELTPQLHATQAGEAQVKLIESQFRWHMNEDAMATEKLAEGIRQFARDQEKLELLFKQL
ncbi:transaldolase [Pseudomonas sp. F1_0610]|uniref:transaldolase n=1 Tax=Pseudomonas sp. F1_0610 TaxID=3114284 RepID=UPI0039C4C107